VRFFLTFEETDWCYRAAAMGIPQYVISDAIVEHVGSASMGSPHRRFRLTSSLWRAAETRLRRP
jgi:GT2 family glycosyltransferase